MAVRAQGNHYDPTQVQNFRMEYSDECVTFKTINNVNGVSAVIGPVIFKTMLKYKKFYNI